MRPYRFERTLVVLAGLALALMVGAAAAVLASHSHLLLDSPRGFRPGGTAPPRLRIK
jgi:hypothetical protein